MRVSLVQFAASTDSAANLEVIARLVRRAVVAGSADHEGAGAAEGGVQGGPGGKAGQVGGAEPHLVVLPEAAMHDLGDGDLALGPVAEPLDGPFVTALSSLAERYGATLVVGMIERSDDPERPYNTLVVIGPGGELIAWYRKLHLYDSFGYQESARLRSGDGDLAVFPLGGLTLGLQTCYDLRFPELSRALVDRGADTLVVPAAWVRGPLKEDHWSTLLRARAIENTAYVLGAGQCGRTYIGCSMAIDPLGTVLAGLGAEEGIAETRLSASEIQRARRLNPSLSNRRLPPSAAG